jgi:hypothetical protein
MVTPVPRRFGLLLSLIALSWPGCDEADHAILEGPLLAVDPCRDGPATFSPFSCDFDMVSWVQAVEDAGWIEMRRGYRELTESDLMVLQFNALADTRAAWTQSPETPLVIDDDTIRLSLLLNQRCPRQVQPLVAPSGELVLDRFDIKTGGRISGHAIFDLRDARAADDTPPAGEAMELHFDLEVRRGRPHEVFTR